jgi:hypothetical protein
MLKSGSREQLYAAETSRHGAGGGGGGGGRPHRGGGGGKHRNHRRQQQQRQRHRHRNHHGEDGEGGDRTQLLRQELEEEFEDPDNPDEENRFLDLILDGKAHLVGVVSEMQDTDDPDAPDGFYSGVYGQFCQVNFDVHKRDPASGTCDATFGRTADDVDDDDIDDDNNNKSADVIYMFSFASFCFVRLSISNIMPVLSSFPFLCLGRQHPFQNYHSPHVP